MKNKYLLAIVIGLIMLITTMGLSNILAVVLPDVQSEYVNPAFRPWDDPIMSLFFVYPISIGILLTYLWFKTRKSWKSGLDFGITLALLLSIPSFLVNYSSFTFSLMMILSWTVMGFVNVLIAGFALEKLEG
jgi:hypothetical protein